MLHAALAPGARAEMLEALEHGGDFDTACTRLRAAMRSHVFPAGGKSFALKRIVQSFDDRARRAGLHVLESWDYRAQRFADEIAPVLMLEHCALRDVPDERRSAALAVMVDHYFMCVLGLLAARAWDDGDPNEHLDRVNSLLGALHGPAGSGARFVDDAESLLLVAISHYHPDERAYDALLASAESLNEAHRLRLALACSAALGGHLRWGLRFMYRRDVGDMRSDNVVDYPWLVFALVTLMREYARPASHNVGDSAVSREHVVESLLNGLSADPWFAAGSTPAWLRSHRAEHAELRESVLDQRDALLGDFAAHQPHSKAYSPLGFDCNFLCNALVGMVATELSEPGPHPSLNDLFSRAPRSGCRPDVVERHAKRLTAYARGGLAANVAALIVYDPYEAAHAYNNVTTVFRQHSAPVGAAVSFSR